MSPSTSTRGTSARRRRAGRRGCSGRGRTRWRSDTTGRRSGRIGRGRGRLPRRRGETRTSCRVTAVVFRVLLERSGCTLYNVASDHERYLLRSLENGPQNEYLCPHNHVGVPRLSPKAHTERVHFTVIIWLWPEAIRFTFALKRGRSSNNNFGLPPPR